MARSALRLASVVIVLTAGSARASAQGWIAQLVLAPMPSPFLSDWEADPSIGELIVTNTSASASDVTFHYSLTRGGQQVLRGVTDPHPVPAQESVVFNAMSTFGGRADWDRGMQDLVAQTGRLPEGDYEGCVTLVRPDGLVLVERECARFSLEYPDPPFLVFPMNGDTLTSQDPIFEWQPVQLSPLADARVGYVLQVAEVRTDAGQIPEVALQSNILHYYEPDLIQSSHQYPIGGMPFVPGRTYAWRVVALGGDGRPIASNQGQSEIWTFVYRDPQQEVEGVVASIALSARRDTLRFAGDTARFEAKAYDADGIELVGKRLDWASLDTNVVRVDAKGIVTGIGEGETRIVASADGVADSALSVTAASETYAIGFEPYDAESDEPSLLGLINSGSFEEVSPLLMDRLRSGTFRIPLPRLPGLDAALTARGGGGAGCPDVSFNVRDPYVDLTEKIFVFYIPLNRAQRQEVTNCLGTPDEDGEVTEVEQERGALFAVSWKHPGLPRAILAVKGLGLGIGLMGPESLARFLVLNVTAPVDVGADLLPTNYKGFFGDVSFEAGIGATFHSRRRCASTETVFCRLLAWFYPGNPAFTIDAFAGVTASEASVGGGTEGAGAGASVALGLSISAKLPVRIWDLDPLGFSLDSTQLGLTFAVQDSIVGGTGADTSASGSNWSIGVAPTLTVWTTGRNGNAWQFDGSVGVEVDPTDPDAAPKLVVTGEVPARWKLWTVRLGNPMLVFTKALEAEGAADLGISGTWGVGPWDGNTAELIGLDDGDTGFEELGRGSVILKWEKPTRVPPTRAQSRVEQAQRRWYGDSLGAAALQQSLDLNCRTAELKAQQAQASAIDAAGISFAAAMNAERDALCGMATQQRLIQEGNAKAHEAEMKAYRTIEEAEAKATAAAPPKPAASGVPTCAGTLVFNDTRCFTWSAHLSMDSASLIDLIALAVRMGTGTR